MKVIDGKKIRAYRKYSLGLSIEQFAEQVGINVPILKNIETERRVCQQKHLDIICEWSNKDPNFFMKNSTKVITLLSNKGGSTKTTSAANIAYSLATQENRRILLIDTDLQQNLSQHYQIEPNTEKNFANAFRNNESVEHHILPTRYDNIDIVISDDALSVLETEIVNYKMREHRMHNILENVIAKGDYDYIIIDCNPSLNLLNRSILFATDYLIVPVDSNSPFGITGMEYILRFFNEIRDDAKMFLNKKINLLGILVNRYMPSQIVTRSNMMLIEEMEKEYLRFNKDKKRHFVMQTKIPQSANIGKSQLKECPVGEFAPQSHIAIAYKELAKEIIDYVES